MPLTAAETIARLYNHNTEEQTAAAREFGPDYPIFKQVGRTGATRYTPSVRDDKFGRVFTYNPDAISISDYDEMRMDGQIRAGLALTKLPIQQSPWSVICDDKDIAAFCTQVLKPIYDRLVSSLLLGLDFGFSVNEIDWSLSYDLCVSETQGQSGGAKVRTYPHMVVPRDIIDLDPQTVYLLAYRWSGDFAGVKQYVGSTGVIPAEKCVLFSNDCEFREWYGISQLRPCYPYWLFKRYQYEWANIAYETNAMPVKKARFPEGIFEQGLDASNNPYSIKNEDVVVGMCDDLRNNTTVALPSSRYEDGNKEYLWDIEYLESGRTGADFIAYIDHLNAMILKSLLVPQLTLETGSVGSYSLAETQVNFFFLGLQGKMRQLEGAINRSILKRLVKYNFGASAPQALFKYQSLSGDLRQGLEQVLLQTIGQGQPIPLKDGSAIDLDWQWMADALGVPVQTLNPDEYEQYQDRNKAMNPPTEPDPSQYGGEPYQYGATGQGADPQAPAQGGPSDGNVQSDASMSEHWSVRDGQLVVRLVEA